MIAFRSIEQIRAFLRENDRPATGIFGIGFANAHTAIEERELSRLKEYDISSGKFFDIFWIGYDLNEPTPFKYLDNGIEGIRHLFSRSDYGLGIEKIKSIPELKRFKNLGDDIQVLLVPYSDFTPNFERARLVELRHFFTHSETWDSIFNGFIRNSKGLESIDFDTLVKDLSLEGRIKENASNITKFRTLVEYSIRKKSIKTALAIIGSLIK